MSKLKKYKVEKFWINKSIQVEPVWDIVIAVDEKDAKRVSEQTFGEPVFRTGKAFLYKKNKYT